VKILTAALALFVRDGLCETSVRDIAAASGMTNPALFKHFESKDHLARFLFERCYLELAHLVAGIVAGGGTFAAKQRAIVDGYLAALERDSDSVLYVQDNLRHFWPKMSAPVRRHSIVGDVRRLLQNGRAERKVDTSLDLELLTVAWIGTLQQIARARFFGDLKQPAAVLADDIDGLLTKLVRP
jgi:AcrR family transcriptional regulator